LKVKLKSPPLPKVAEYLNAQIHLSGLKQKDISTALGYTKPNIITMFKQGLTKLPIEKVGPLARALGLDPIYLLRITMNDYMPDTYAAVIKMFGQEPATEHEQDIIAAIREMSGGKNLEMRTPESEAKLAEFVATLS
jgi:hypothetical protein